LNTLAASIYQPLEFLIYTSIILLIIIGVFLIKLLVDFSSLLKCSQDFIKATQAELEPTIKEIHATLININNISSNVNSQLNSINDGVRKGAKYLSEVAALVGDKAKNAGGLIKKNLLSGIYLLMSSKKNK